MPHTQSIVVKQTFLFQFLLLYWIKHIEGILRAYRLKYTSPLTISVPPPIQCDMNYTYGLHTVFFYHCNSCNPYPENWYELYAIFAFCFFFFSFNTYAIFCSTVPFELNKLIVVFFIWSLFRFFVLLMLIALVKIGEL